MSKDTCISRRGALASASLVAASTAMLAAGRVYGEEFAEAIPLSPIDAISFLYIDNTQLDAGAEQNVVVSLSQHTGVSAAVLTVQDEAGPRENRTGFRAAEKTPPLPRRPIFLIYANGFFLFTGAVH